jgi:hypothetical protein
MGTRAQKAASSWSTGEDVKTGQLRGVAGLRTKWPSLHALRQMKTFQVRHSEDLNRVLPI